MDEATSGEGGRPLPRPPWPRHPGLVRRLMTDPRPVLDELRQRHGPVVGLGAGPLRLAVVGDPVALRELFALPPGRFRWGHRFNVLGFVVGERSLIVSDGEDWERRRRSVRAGFSRRRLNGWVGTIVERTDAHLDRLVAGLGPSGGPATVDLDPFGRALVQEVVVRTLFGERLAGRSDEIAGRFRSSQAYLESPFHRQLPHPFPLGRRAAVRADLVALRAIVDEQVAHLRARPGGDPLDVLEALLEEGTLSDDEVQDQVVSLLGAGLDTTSASLAWVLARTARAGPELWARLRSEADDVLGGVAHDRRGATPPAGRAPAGGGTPRHRAPGGAPAALDEGHLARLELADRVVREATRLHPAGSFSPRMAHVDLVVGGYRVPRGTLVLWSAHLAGRDPEAWARPLEFDPDRFLGMSPAQAALAEAAWVPFGRGARNCIGFALARMELTLILARTAQRLDVEPLDAAEPRAVGMVVNRPEGGVPLRVSAR